MGMHCQGGLSDPGITAGELPKECAPSRADSGSLSLESADKSNKDMLSDHYYSQVRVVIFYAGLWGREAPGDVTALGAVVWKSDTYLWLGSMGCYAFEINRLRALSCDRNLPEAATLCRTKSWRSTEPNVQSTNLTQLSLTYGPCSWELLGPLTGKGIRTPWILVYLCVGKE